MVRTLVTALLVVGGVQAQEKAREETGTVSGRVHIDGVVPAAKKIPMDAACAALHPEPPRTEFTIVDAKNNVRGAFVWVKKGLEGRKFPVPPEPVLLDQVNCRYEPHVFGIRIGQTLRIRNSDGFLHNVHGLGFDNPPFNFGQPVKGQVSEVKLVAEEVMMKIKCDIHGWMASWAGVMEHPYFAVTDASGAFSIPGLPPGKYTVAVWQEEWTAGDRTKLEREVVVKAGETVPHTFELDKKKE